MHLKVVFEPAQEGGCISEGDTLDEARQNIREAVDLYLEPTDRIEAPTGGVVEDIVV